jgi:hypothetical protein
MDESKAIGVMTVEWWAVFMTIVAVTSLITYGFQEKANRWVDKEIVGKRVVMWAELLAIPVCCALGWQAINQAPVDFISPFAGLVAGLVGSMASPWFIDLLSRLRDKKLKDPAKPGS